MEIITVVAASILLQLAAVGFAFRLTWITGKRAAWTLIAGAVLLMALRRCITFAAYLSGDASTPPDLATELIALTISVLMLAGIIGIAPSFRSRREAEQKLREQQEWFRVALTSAGDAVIATGADQRVNFMNPIAERLTGWGRNEADGRPLSDVFNIVNEGTREPVESPAEKVLRTGAVVGLANHTVLIARDGTEFAIADSGAPIKEAGEIRGVILVFRDITEERRAERRLLAQHEAARILAEATTIEEAIPTILEGVCLNLGWDVGALWTFDETHLRLRCVTLWHRRSIEISEFEAQSLSRTFARGEGLPGRVLASGKPAWVTNAALDPSLPRIELAGKSGLHGAFGIPIALNEDIIGVMEFFSRETREPDDEMLAMMTTVGSQVGQFIERRRAEAERRESESLKDSILTSALDCIITIDEHSRVVEWNPAAEQTFGYSRSEAIGRSMTELIVPPELRERHHRGLDHYLKTGEGPVLRKRIEIAGMRKGGSIFPVELAITPIRLSNKQLFTAYLRDLSERKRAEDATRESQERLELAIDIAQMGTFEIDLASDAVVVNEPGRAIYGWESAHTTFAEVQTHFHPEDKPEVMRQVEAALDPNGSGIFEVEQRIYRTDGVLRWLRVRGHAFFDGEGPSRRAVRCVGTYLDITESKQAQAALREGEERLRLIMENVDDHAILTLDLDGKVSGWNAGAEQAFGYTKDEIIGRDGTVIFTPEDREAGRLDVEMKLSATEGRAMDQRWHIRKDGSRFWANGSMEGLRDAEGRLKGFVKIVRDETERKRIEEEREEHLQKEQQRAEQLHRLADIATRLTVAHDIPSTTGVITEEARRLIGSHQAVVTTTVDQNWAQAINAVSLSEKYEAWASYESPPNGSGIYSLVCRTNKPMRMTQEELEQHPAWKQFSGEGDRHPPMRGWLAVPLIGRDGKNLGLIQLSDRLDGEFTEEDEVILMQLAHLASVAIENARLYDELRRNDKRKDEFLAMLAHELRNPLAAVGNAVAVLKMSDDAESINFAKDVIERQTKQLAQLIDDLLDVSRITSGKIRLRRDLIDAGPVLDQAIQSARPLIDERKHELIVSIDRDNLPINADAMRLEQIVVNLLTNAAKYTESGGKIWLSAAHDDGQVVIRVRDNGMGIPPEKLPEMFQLFAQGERSIARSEGGLGIGLTIVQKLAEMHGGSASATSEGLGKGSEFTVRLPAARRSVSKGTKQRRAEGAVNRGSRILVVDDSVDTAQGLARLLTLLGNEVQMVHDGPSAVNTAPTFRPDFVLLDLGLPGMDGYQVASKLREEKHCKGCTIVAISGYGQEEDRRRSRAAGCDHHLVKPVEFDALVSLLAQVH